MQEGWQGRKDQAIARLLPEQHLRRLRVSISPWREASEVTRGMRRAERHLPATSALVPGAGGHQTAPTGVGSRARWKEAGWGSPNA